MVKIPSKKKTRVSKELADALADELSDKPYGKNNGSIDNKKEQDYRRLTISMKEDLFDKLDELSRRRKKQKAQVKTMSAIADEAIREYFEKCTMD